MNITFNYTLKNCLFFKALWNTILINFDTDYKEFKRMLLSHVKLDTCQLNGHRPHLYFGDDNKYLIYIPECSLCAHSLAGDYKKSINVPPPQLVSIAEISQKEWQIHQLELESEIRSELLCAPRSLVIIDISYRIESILVGRQLSELVENPIYVSPTYWDNYSG